MKTSKKNGSVSSTTSAIATNGKEEKHTKKCQHKKLTREQRNRKPFLKRSSSAYKAMESVVIDKSLLNTLLHLLESESEIERTFIVSLERLMDEYQHKVFPIDLSLKLPPHQDIPYFPSPPLTILSQLSFSDFPILENDGHNPIPLRSITLLFLMEIYSNFLYDIKKLLSLLWPTDYEIATKFIGIRRLFRLLHLTLDAEYFGNKFFLKLSKIEKRDRRRYNYNEISLIDPQYFEQEIEQRIFRFKKFQKIQKLQQILLSLNRLVMDVILKRG